ncbi:MAG: ankyrin repeat domain-containing protein, partial [Verrucomicrobiota bacterium]|nr:ankyrin repeat domain-containing protein [Verrucomicrobiota bacterium]
MKQLLITTIAAVVLVGCGVIKPIYDAALEGNIDVIKQHLANGTDVETLNRHGETPLYLAAAEGHKEIVELLIAAGADVNVKIGDNKMTPLPMAARDGSIEIVELL